MSFRHCPAAKECCFRSTRLLHVCAWAAGLQGEPWIEHRPSLLSYKPSLRGRISGFPLDSPLLG